MGRPAQALADARLNDLAAALESIPARIAVLESTVDHLEVQMDSVPAQLAVLAATVNHLAEENRALHADLTASQRHLVQLSCALLAATLGAAGAIIGALI
jgi:chromosome segregation ATPase